MLHHAVGIDAETGLAVGFRLEVVKMRVPPHEERLAVLVRPLDEIERHRLRSSGFRQAAPRNGSRRAGRTSS